MRAKVIFADGFNVSPTIETTNRKLRERLARVVKECMSPARAAALFAVQSYAGGYPMTLHNTPSGASYGGTIAGVQRQEFWPSMGDQAGVFWVDMKDEWVEFWGGEGFTDTPEYTKAIAQREEFEFDED